MRFATVLVPEVGPATGPDLTRYALVCALSIGALLALAWVFRRIGYQQVFAVPGSNPFAPLGG